MALNLRLSKKSSRDDDEHYNSCFQRVVVVHWKLAEISTGSALGETASIREQLEELLYSFGFDESDELAVLNFLGVCKALFRLAEVFSDSPDHDTNSCTHFAVLENSVLVFQPLEEDVEIVAIAQIGKGAANSETVRAILRQAYELFCLLRGGGIDRRMKQRADVDISEIYPGMGRLYELYKEKRRFAKESPDEGSEQMHNIDQQIAFHYDELPLSRLKRELKVHYDAFLGEIYSFEHCMFRSGIVSNDPKKDSLPIANALTQSCGRRLVASFQDFLMDRKGGCSFLFGGCVFLHGSPLGASFISNDEPRISANTTDMLFCHMNAFRSQIIKLSHSAGSSQTNSGTSTPTQRKRGLPQLPQLILSLGSRFNDAQQPPVASAQSGFLSVPPLSLLSSLDDTYSLEGPQEGNRIWLLPFTDRNADGSFVDAYASLFVHGEISVLLYFHRYEIPDASWSISLFRLFEERFVAKLDSQVKTDQTLLPLKLAPGCNVVLVDRERNRTFLTMEDAASLSSCLVEYEPWEDSHNQRLSHIISREVLNAVHDATLEAKECSEKFEMCTALQRHWIYSRTRGHLQLYVICEASSFSKLSEVLDYSKGIASELLC